MSTKEKDREIRSERTDHKSEMHPVPVMALRWMTDEEWNRLAYQNFLERQAVKDGKEENIHGIREKDHLRQRERKMRSVRKTA